MDYTKHTWENGEIITADKLNNLENGVANGSGGSGVFNVNSSFDEQRGVYALDKTWQEIYDASKNGALVVVTNTIEETGSMSNVKEIVHATSYGANSNPKYRVCTFYLYGGTQGATMMYVCDSNTDFPYLWHND